MIDGEAQGSSSSSDHQGESTRMPALELSRLPAAAITPAPVAPAPAPAPAPVPAPAPSTVEVAISSSQQEQLMKKISVTPALPSRALRCALRGLTEDDCAVLSHCAARGPLVGAMPSLRLIDLSYNSIGDEGLRRLAGLLAAAPALEKLSLYENKASSLGPVVAALHAHGGPSLRVLNLAWNRLHSAGPLAAALAAGAAPLLADLRLDSNRLGDASAAALAAAFVEGAGAHLEILVLGTDRAGNLIGDDGLLELVDSLGRGLPRLRELGLSNNPIGDASATQLANCLSLGR